MPRARSQWLIDQHPEVPVLENVADAFALWETLLAERDYRLHLLRKGADDKKVDAMVDDYGLCDDIARAMIEIEATTCGEVSKKLTVALNVLEGGGTNDGFEMDLLRSAQSDARTLDRPSRSPTRQSQIGRSI